MVRDRSSVLAVITARSGSKGVPGKNLRPLKGKPLLVWTIEAALAAKCVSRTIVSTDGTDIAEVAVRAGAEVPFLRPATLASDTASSEEVVAHAIQECPGHDVVMLLQPTSPLRNAEDIDAAFAKMQHEKAESCVSISQTNMSPWLMFRLSEREHLHRVLPPWIGGMRRQDLPPVYVLNGAMYLVTVESFMRDRRLVGDHTVGHVLPAERSLDIDTFADFELAEALLRTQESEIRISSNHSSQTNS